MTKFDEEKPSAELLSERLMKEQTFEGWNEVFQTNVSSCTSYALSRQRRGRRASSADELALSSANPGFFMSAAFLPLLAKFTSASLRRSHVVGVTQPS